MKHEHRWIFLGELALTLSESEQRRGEVSFRRAEYCGVCGCFRAQFGEQWASIKSETTSSFLSRYDEETDTVVPGKPPELYKKPSPAPKRRLGRGISDLMKQVQQQGTSLPILRR